MPAPVFAVSIARLWAEGRGRPSFLANDSPSLSWQIHTDSPDWTQVSAEIETVVGSERHVTVVQGPCSQHVEWQEPALLPYQSAVVRVRVTGSDDARSEFSAPIVLRTGPLNTQDWTAPFIAAGAEGSENNRGTVRFRTEFTPRARISEAVLSVTAHGVYEAVLNGRIVGDEVLTPGWTSYDARLTFQSYDVIDLIGAVGANVLGATVGEGWYGERYGFDGNFARGYPGPAALAMQLRLLYDDGSVDVVQTGSTWTASLANPSTRAGIYAGERYDARLEDGALSAADTPFPAPLPVTTLESDAARLTPSFAPPVRRIETLAPQKILSTPSGKTILDFGQNLVGWLELTVDAAAGHEVTLRHAEVLEHGELGVRPLRFAEATDHFTSRGEGPHTWSPRFTFHGFRYAEVTNWPGDLGLGEIRAVVVHNDMVRTGYLETSNARLNQLHDNVLWGMRGNFLSLPTDCPQRDERLGWTGDIQVFTPTAGYLYDVSGFLESWLRDVAAEQARAGGTVPFVVPNPLPMAPLAAAAWGDAATLVPDALFTRYADEAALATAYPSMRDWVDTVNVLAGDNHLWTGGFQFGDWLDPSAPPENPTAAKTHPDIVATAYFFRSTERLAAAARVLGHDDDAGRYAELAEDIRSAFLNEYVTPAGRILSDAHTAYALALVFGLITEPALVRTAGARLAELVRSHGYRIGTGFVGTPLICDALCLAGQSDVAYRLLLEEGCPSWLYPITMGATTIWERWDSMLPDGSINPGEMTSFNHYALGAVADWMHRAIGGIAPGAPGYGVIDVAPILGGGLTWASASLDTGYGVVRVDWTLRGGDFALTVEIPPNSSARVLLPGASGPVTVGSGRHVFDREVSAHVRRDVPGPLTMETSLSEIIGDAEAVTALEALFVEIGYPFGLGWTAGGHWTSESPIGSALIMMPPAGVTRVEALLTELNGR